MKKLLALLLALVLVFGLAACGGNQPAPTPTPAPPAGIAPPGAEPLPGNGGEWHPTRDITGLVGHAAGGGMDVMMRLLIPGLEHELGVNIIPLGMPGANSAISAEHLVSSPADGYMIWAFSSAATTFPASGISDLFYNDLQMIAVVQSANPVITVPVDSPIETFEDFIEALQTGNTTASNGGLGGIWHLPQVVILGAVGGDAIFVPYEGGRPAANAVAQGEVDWGMSCISEAMSFIQDGFSRPLAIYRLTDLYLEGYGNIPSILNWLPELEELIPVTDGFRGIGVRRGTPQNIIDTLVEALKYASNTPEFISATEGAHNDVVQIFGEDADALTQFATRLSSWIFYDLGFAERSPAEVGVPRP